MTETPTAIVDFTAEKLDKRIRRLAGSFDHTWHSLEKLIAEAKARKIHTALGFTSWPDYIADVARREMPNVSRSVEQRRQVVALMTGEGMSQRSIAAAVGVNHATISRDQAAIDAGQVLHDATPEPGNTDATGTVVGDDRQATLGELTEENRAVVTGRDGKTYPRQKLKGKPAEPVVEPPKVEVAADPPPVWIVQRTAHHIRALRRHAKALEKKLAAAEPLSEFTSICLTLREAQQLIDRLQSAAEVLDYYAKEPDGDN